MLVGCMKDGKHGSRLRGMKEGRSEWIGTEGAEPGTGSRGRGPRSDHRELRTLERSHSQASGQQSSWAFFGLKGTGQLCALEAALWLPPCPPDPEDALAGTEQKTEGPPSGPVAMPLLPSTQTFSPKVPSANGNAGPLRCGIFDVLMYKCIKRKAAFHTSSTFLYSLSFISNSLLKCPHFLLDGLFDSILTDLLLKESSSGPGFLCFLFQS